MDRLILDEEPTEPGRFEGVFKNVLTRRQATEQHWLVKVHPDLTTEITRWAAKTPSRACLPVGDGDLVQIELRQAGVRLSTWAALAATQDGTPALEITHRHTGNRWVPIRDTQVA